MKVSFSFSKSFVENLVPNLPCGVESFKLFQSVCVRIQFLIYRVELKEFALAVLSRICLFEFLIYRVELKVLNPHMATPPYVVFLIYRVELKVASNSKPWTDTSNNSFLIYRVELKVLIMVESKSSQTSFLIYRVELKERLFMLAIQKSFLLFWMVPNLPCGVESTVKPVLCLTMKERS